MNLGEGRGRRTRVIMIETETQRYSVAATSNRSNVACRNACARQSCDAFILLTNTIFNCPIARSKLLKMRIRKRIARPRRKTLPFYRLPAGGLSAPFYVANSITL
jgi:hypothetical protein